MCQTQVYHPLRYFSGIFHELPLLMLIVHLYIWPKEEGVDCIFRVHGADTHLDRSMN